MNRLESCPLNKKCKKTKKRFYRNKKDLRSCENYWRCKTITAAWKFPIEEYYDKNGKYLKVCTKPTITEWSQKSSFSYPGVLGEHCQVFFKKDYILIGSWLHRTLKVPQEEDFINDKFDEDFGFDFENNLAMEIKQIYHSLGFMEAVSINKNKDLK